MWYDKATIKKEVVNMKIKLNPDQAMVDSIKEGLKRTGGYCPCRRERTEATKCMCQEFKDQIADPDFEGFCPTTNPCRIKGGTPCCQKNWLPWTGRNASPAAYVKIPAR